MIDSKSRLSPNLKLAIVSISCLLIGIGATIFTQVILSNFNQQREPQNRLISNIAQPMSDSDLKEKGLKSIASFDYFLRLYSDLESQTMSELKQSLYDASSIQHSVRKLETQTAIIRRMVQLNPKETLKLIDTFEGATNFFLTRLVFEEWAQNNLDPAIAFAKTLSEQRLPYAASGIFHTRNDLNEAQKAQILQDLGIEDFEQLRLVVQPTASKSINPKQDWETLLSDSEPDEAQISILLRLADERLEQEGLSALHEINQDLEESWNLNRIILTSLFHQVEDLEAAFDVALSLTDEEYNRFLTTVSTNWVIRDPQAALQKVAGITSSQLRRNTQSSIVWGWAERQPLSLLENVDLLPESFHNVGIEEAIKSLAKSDPQLALRYFSDVKNEHSIAPIAYQIAESWANLDPKAALNWVKTEPLIKDLTDSLLNPIITSLAKTDVEFALEVALERPIGEDGYGKELYVIGAIASQNLEQALALLPRVRPGRTLLSAYQSVSSGLVQAGEYDRALSLAYELEPEFKNEFLDSVVHTWSREAPEELYNALEKLPSKELQSEAAYYLIQANPWQRALSDSQINGLVTYLSDGQKELMERQGLLHTD